MLNSFKLSFNSIQLHSRGNNENNKKKNETIIIRRRMGDLDLGQGQ